MIRDWERRHAAAIDPAPPTAMAQTCTRPYVVLDTNIVLDVLVFQEPDALALRMALEAASLRWLATTRMRDELQRVLGYPHIEQRLRFHGLAPEQVLARRDRWVQQVQEAPRCDCICKDADDQCFIDLAVAHGALLLSKDDQVLRLRKRLARQGVVVSRRFPVRDAAVQP
jgi:putative PIN family toxin of toxin-antitoxin system